MDDSASRSSALSQVPLPGLAVASINRQLEVLRRLLKLAVEWGKVEKVLPKVEMLTGENHRDRVLSFDEEQGYLAATSAQSSCYATRRRSCSTALYALRTPHSLR